MITLDNKWIRGALPALLIHCSIGTVYCWSLLRDGICEACQTGKDVTEWAFSLAIFFLGMSAAFCGNLVEKNVRYSGFLSTACFTLGMIGTGLSIHFGSIVGVLLCYGCIMGIGLGTGYLTPVKTLMMWFSEHKGLATGIAITGFGLAKVIASPIIQALLEVTSIESLFYILGASYCVLMSIGAALIKKPGDKVKEMKGESFNLKESLKFILNPKYLAIWFVFYLNITCGLALISQEKPFVSEVGLLGMVALIASLTAALNALGRFGYATISDTLRDRGVVYFAIFLSSAVFTLLGGIGMIANLSTPILIIGMLLICNAGYGGGFSTLPALLTDKFGMKNVSVIHGFALSAWAWAGLSGNQLGNWVITTYGYPDLLWILTGLYSVAMIVTWIWIMDRSPKTR